MYIGPLDVFLYFFNSVSIMLGPHALPHVVGAWEPEIRCSLPRPYRVLLLCVCRWFIFRFWDGHVELQKRFIADIENVQSGLRRH